MTARGQAGGDAGLLRHGTLMVAGTFAGALCNAGFHMVVGRTLPNAEYGALVTMLGLILVVSTPMLALQNTLAHFTAQFILDGRPEEIRPLFRHWAGIFAALGLGLVASAWFFRAPLAAVWSVPPRLIVLTFAVLAASLWMSLFQGLRQGLQRFAWLAWAPQAWGAVRLALGAGFTIYVAATAFTPVVAQGLGVLAVLALGLLAAARLHLPPGAPGARPHATYRYLGSALVCLGGYALLMNLDATLAKHYFDAETAGLFAKAATIARTAVFLPVPVAAALFPKVTSTGGMTDQSWRLLGRALAFAGLLIAAVAGLCVAWPQLPWTILYGRPAPADAAAAVAYTRAMVLAASPLALTYLLLNFEMAQRRFAWCYGLVPAGLAYLGGVALFHTHPLQIPAVLGAANLAGLALLVAGIARQRARDWVFIRRWERFP